MTCLELAKETNSLEWLKGRAFGSLPASGRFGSPTALGLPTGTPGTFWLDLGGFGKALVLQTRAAASKRPALPW